MKEIGGYIELDTYRLPMMHDGAIALNCGRNALAYVIRARGIQKIALPFFICDSVTGVCEREHIATRYYHIGKDLMPEEDISLAGDEWLYLVNYYGQLSNDDILHFKQKYERVIVDNAQSYFQTPVKGIDTLYTCRKYFGVPDGAFLYTDSILKEELPADESHERMGFLLGRFERPASEYYSAYAANNAMFAGEPLKRMSKLTDNLLHGIDYEQVFMVRRENFSHLHRSLKDRNLLNLKTTGSFMYPLLVEDGAEIRKKLQNMKIYVPKLWPTVAELSGLGSTESYLAENILPLPTDQRYGITEMDYLTKCLKKCMKV